MSDHDLEIALTLGKMDGRLEGLEKGQAAAWKKLDAFPCSDHRVALATLKSELPGIVAVAIKEAMPAPAPGLTIKQVSIVGAILLAGIEAVKALI